MDQVADSIYAYKTFIMVMCIHPQMGLLLYTKFDMI